jgi:hypothetical protein
MTRFWIATLILILFTLLKPAPSTALLLQGPPPPPPPSREYFPERWENFASDSGRFRARFPGKVKESAEANPNGAPETHSVSHKGILEYAISYVDLPNPIADTAERRQILKNLKDAALNQVRAANPQVIKESEADVKGHPGYFIHLEIGDREVVRLKWVLVGNRLYSIVAGGRKGSPNEMEGKDDFEKMAMGFINSFDLVQ